MKNDAFDLRWWSLDQALIWISSRDLEAVVSGSSWVDFRVTRLGVWNPKTKEEEYEFADPVVHPQEAEQQLLLALKNGQIEGFNGTEKLEPIWFDQAEYSSSQHETLFDETLLVNWHLPVTVQIKMLSGGGKYIQRINPDENKIPVRVPSAQVLARFPAQEQGTALLEQQDHMDGNGLETSQAQGITITDTGTKPKKRRKPGAVSLQSDDAPLLIEMHRLITTREAPSVSAAAGMVVNRAKGHGSEESKLRRLRGRYADQYDPRELE